MGLLIAINLLLAHPQPSDPWRALLADRIIVEKISGFEEGGATRLNNGMLISPIPTECNVGDTAQVALFEQPKSSLDFKYHNASLIYCGKENLIKTLPVMRERVEKTLISTRSWRARKLPKSFANQDVTQVHLLPSDKLIEFLAVLRKFKNDNRSFSANSPLSRHIVREYVNAVHYVYDNLKARFGLPRFNEERFEDKYFRNKVIDTLLAAAMSERSE